MEGKLTKLAGPPHCCNCTNSEEREDGWHCNAPMWDGALIYPEPVSMSWSWGVWVGDDEWVGFIREYGCRSYAPREPQAPTDREREWARKVERLVEMEVELDMAPAVDEELGRECDLLDDEVYRLSEKIRTNQDLTKTRNRSII